LRVQRLQPGGLFKPLPPDCVSEGEQAADPNPALTEAYVPACTALDATVRRIHRLARAGRIDTQTAERHLNAHLAAACARPGDVCRPAWLVMPLADAPQFGNLPDLWPALHQALAAPDSKDQQGLSAVLLQTLPCFRRTSPAGEQGGESVLAAEGLAPVLLNLMLALLLGLYPDATAKPQFRVRSRIFGTLHAVLTSESSAQEGFIQRHMAVATLALLEYVARVVPACMPAEETFLRQTFGMALFFEHTPLLCSEFRSGLTELANQPGACALTEADWRELDVRASEAVERASRVKRRPQPAGELRRSQDDANPDWRTALACPAVPSGSADDYKILAHAYALPNHGSDVERFHSLIQIEVLPAKILQLQQAALRQGGTDRRCAWMRARQYICPACLARRSVSVLRHELRVDTLNGGLVCSDCRCTDVLAVNLLVITTRSWPTLRLRVSFA